MRKLMWFSVGFAAAIALGVYLLPAFTICILALLCFIPGVVLCFLKNKPCRIAAAILLGVSIGFSWLWGYDGLFLGVPKALHGQELKLTITASDYSVQTDYGVSCDGVVTVGGREYAICFYLNENLSISPGDTVTGIFSVSCTTAGENSSAYHSGKGVFLQAHNWDSVRIEHTQEIPRSFLPAQLRRSILDLLERMFPEDAAPFAKALLLGDTSEISFTQDRAFRTSGISHLVAVSGMHVSILFSLVYTLTGRKRLLTALIGIPVLLLFTAVAGFAPSIVRACIMQILVILALVLKREYDPPTALSFAVLLMLAINPMTVTSAGFQLSVACMAGIFAFFSPIYSYLERTMKLKKYKPKTLLGRLGRSVAVSVSMNVSATVATIPLCAIHFGAVSIVSLLTNLLVLWAANLAFYGIMIACALGAIWFPAGQAVAWLMAWPVRLVLFVSEKLGNIPLAAVYTQSPYVVIWLIFVYAMLFAFWKWGNKHPKIFLYSVLTGLVAAVLLSWLEPRLDHTRATVLDVGQGQCIVLQSGNRWYMVDCGSEDDGRAANAAADYLLSQGVFCLDGVILTHYDEDHAGDLVYLLDAVDTYRLYLPDLYDDAGRRVEIQQRYGEKIHWIGENMTLPLEDGCIQFYPAENPSDDNESSMCTLFRSKKYDILITGDRSISGERRLMERVQLPPLELLIAGHHGAKGATGLELLLSTTPKVVAISVDADNHYAHPSEDTLKRLETVGCRIYRTDQQGTLIFRG